MIAQVIKQISNSGESSADSHKLYKFLQKNYNEENVFQPIRRKSPVI